MSTVLQPWVEKMPWKCQSILFSGLRGPDHALCPGIKKWSRWMRMVSQKNADPSKPYMRDDGLPSHDDLEKELEHSTCHFVHHFADALRCIAIWHPEVTIQQRAHALHYYIAEELFHWIPELDTVFMHRHRDRVDHE